jgi:O-antigen/teichoic acid export membrane protein
MNGRAHPISSAPQAKFIRDSSLFSVTLVLGGICNTIRAFFIAKLLGPQGFGIWRFINIFVEYLHFASLGTQPAMHRSVPFLRGKGDIEKLQLVLKTVSATTFFCSIVYTLAIFAWSFFLADASTAKALAAFSPVILVLAYLQYAKEFSLATGLYALRRCLESVDVVLSMALCVTLINFWGIYGAIAGAGISALVAVLISIPQLWQHFAFTIDRHILRNLIVTGLPILADTVLMITMANSDRILIAAMLSREILGIYSIGAAGVSILGMIPSALGQMLFVKFAEMDGLNKTKDHISDVLGRTTILLSSLWAPIVCLAIGGFPIAVVFLLPQYAGGIGAGKLLIAAVFFLGVSLPATKWCVSTGRFTAVLVLRVVVVAAEFIALYVVIRSTAKLEFVALCVLSSFAIFHAGVSLVCNHLLEKSFRHGLQIVTRSTLPFFSVIVGLWTQDYMYSTADYVAGFQLFVSCFVGLVASLLASVPFLIWANCHTRVIDLLLNRFGSLAPAKISNH